MATLPCPYCGHALPTESDDPLDRCPRCDGALLIAYRYRLVAARGTISGGELYEAVVEGFGEKVAVLFANKADDANAVESFLGGNRLFAELGGRGLARVHEIASRGDRRPYVVMDWISGGTLESRVTRRGPLDQAALFDVVKDLLAGLGRAHRSMPAITHGHIHPGKIGFIDDSAVLFGFEWAKQVFEQDSNLADAFVEDARSERESARAVDLRMLGVALIYAVTGEWIADQPLAKQRALAKSRIPGPLGVAFDRMLGAGYDGYASAVDAALDLQNLLRGSSSWRSRKLKQQDRSQDFVSKTWSANAVSTQDHYPVDDIETIEAIEAIEAVDDVEDIEDLYDDEVAASDALRAPPSSPPPVRAANFDSPQYQQYLEAVAQAASEAEQTPNPGKTVGLVIGAMVVFGTCVAGLVADDMSDDYTPPPPIVYEPPMIPEAIEVPSYEPDPAYASSSIQGIHRYAGTITGPEDIAGRELGERCEVWVEPTGTEGLNCRWYIDCGDPRQRIYGGGGGGYSTCTVADGHPTSAADHDDDAPDGAFMGVLDGPESMVLVNDRWLLPPTRVLISVDEGGGFHPGPIPDTPLAPRLEYDAILSAMERGESPEFNAGPPDQLSDEQLLAVLDTSLGDLHGCEVEPGTTIMAAIDIRPNGRIRKVALDPQPEDGAVERCVVQAIRGLRFPEFTGEPMSINWNVSW